MTNTKKQEKPGKIAALRMDLKLFKETVRNCYLEELRKLFFSKDDTTFKILKFMKQTRIRLSERILPLELMNETLSHNGGFKKYKIEFLVCKPGYVDVVIHHCPLMPSGQGLVMLFIGTIIRHHTNIKSYSNKVIKIKKSANALA